MAQLHVSMASNTSSSDVSQNVMGQHLIDDHAAAAAFINSQLSLTSAAPGLEILYEACRQVYPQQENPLQVTAFIKYWLGGPDPLDYISMYDHPGIPELHIPPHWHYISFGLTDLHGDARVHEPSGPDLPSGFGFELTFRLMKPLGGSPSPPTWPAALLQSLAKYVFHTGNAFFAGDHISWHCPLDGSDFECRLQHMLLAEDILLPPVQGALGSVKFLQVVAVTEDELQVAQHWNGTAVLELLRRVPAAGGPWLVANMQRQMSLFELQPSFRREVDLGIDRDGCSLSGVSARVHWEERKVATKLGSAWRSPEAEEEEDDEDGGVSSQDEEEEGAAAAAAVSQQRRPESAGEIWPIRRLQKGVHLTLNMEAASLLPVVLRGRLRHDRHFTFKAATGDTAVTLVTGRVGGALASTSAPLVAKGPWLQILVDPDWLNQLETDLAGLQQPDSLVLPKTWCFGERQMALTVVPDE
uniref:Suppressor of fused homolog n=1 Tax=Alona affinis TaxID=381656 RepID=A0A9N6ZG04_9CRUS|nr:EOG090X09WX [Alona affinis]